MTYGPMYAYVAYIGNTLFPDGDCWDRTAPVAKSELSASMRNGGELSGEASIRVEVTANFRESKVDCSSEVGGQSGVLFSRCLLSPYQPSLRVPTIGPITCVIPYINCGRTGCLHCPACT